MKKDELEKLLEPYNFFGVLKEDFIEEQESGSRDYIIKFEHVFGISFFLKSYKDAKEKESVKLLASIDSTAIANFSKNNYLENVISGKTLKDEIKEISPYDIGDSLANFYNEIHQNGLSYRSDISKGLYLTNFGIQTRDYSNFNPITGLAEDARYEMISDVDEMIGSIKKMITDAVEIGEIIKHFEEVYNLENNLKESGRLYDKEIIYSTSE